ncbi:MAG TPA: hypothetical protein VFP47_02930 [Pyrinomonadaceae bacterium]|nr:hypothetical protein [Pyrinomonadaceae bacterium]
MRTQLLKFVRGECSGIILTIRRLRIDTNGFRCPGNMKGAGLSSVEMIAQRPQELRQATICLRVWGGISTPLLSGLIIKPRESG